MKHVPAKAKPQVGEVVKW